MEMISQNRAISWALKQYSIYLLPLQMNRIAKTGYTKMIYYTLIMLLLSLITSQVTIVVSFIKLLRGNCLFYEQIEKYYLCNFILYRKYYLAKTQKLITMKVLKDEITSLGSKIMRKEQKLPCSSLSVWAQTSSK